MGCPAVSRPAASWKLIMNVPPAASGVWPEEHCTLTTDTGLGGSTWGEMKSQGFSFSFFFGRLG